MNLDLAAAIYDELLPGWRDARLVSGNRRVVCPLHDDHDPSFDIHEEKLVWTCRSGCGGGGAWDLAVRIIGEDGAHELVERLDAKLGTSQIKPRRATRPAHRREADLPEWRVLQPVPADAVAPDFTHYELGEPDASVTGNPWCYTDAEGRTLCYVVRFRAPDGGKTIRPLVFAENTRTGRRSWRWQGFPEPRPLYGLAELAQRPDAPVLVLEGEKACDAARRLFPECACVSPMHGAQSPAHTDWTPLRGRKVVVWPDADPVGRAFAEEASRLALAAGATSATIVPVPADAPEGWDLADALPEGWDQERLHKFLEPPPLAPLLERIMSLLRKYVVFQNSEHAAAIALWVAHTHIFEQFDTTPYLSITSPEPRSGKSRLLEVLEALSARSWCAITPSVAVVYRKIARDKPTFLLDEVDAIYGPKAGEHEDLRAVLNAGYRRGAIVPRCEGKGDITLKDFEVYCPKALAGIGKLPATVADRSLPIRLERRTKSEKVAKFRRREITKECDPIRSDVERWAKSVDLSEARPTVPDELGDRAADCWEPLLAIADAAGGGWPERARGAARKISGGQEELEASVGVRLLADIRGVFDGARADALSTEDLLEGLNELEDAPWGDFKGRPMNAHGLSRLLKPYRIKPGTVRLGNGRGSDTKKGYTRHQLEPAWGRYVPSTFTAPTAPPPSRVEKEASHRHTDDFPQEGRAVTEKRETSHRPSLEAHRHTHSSARSGTYAMCDGVTDLFGGERVGGEAEPARDPVGEDPETEKGEL